MDYVKLWISIYLLVDIFVIVQCKVVSVNSVNIYFYSPLKRREVQINEDTIIPNLSFNLPLKVLVHGWTANRNHITIAPIKDAYLAIGESLIIADWSDGSTQNYDKSRNFIPKVALRVFQILDRFMKNHYIYPGDVHLIGHSLGAHICGNIGKYFNGTIGRITGLDPAGPLFVRKTKDALTINDAKFIDSIHTDVGVLGELTQRSHIDFYPNRGFPPQPGCALLDLLTASSCSHFRAPLFYAESIMNPKQFLAARCDRNSLFNSIKLCKPKYNLHNSSNLVYMGMNVQTTARGIFYLETNRSPPYGRGSYLTL